MCKQPSWFVYFNGIIENGATSLHGGKITMYINNIYFN